MDVVHGRMQEVYHDDTLVIEEWSGFEGVRWEASILLYRPLVSNRPIGQQYFTNKQVCYIMK